MMVLVGIVQSSVVAPIYSGRACVLCARVGSEWVLESLE